MSDCRIPLKIQNYTISSQIILAPMSGVTDYPFRKIVRKISPDSLVMSEMIACHGFLYKGKKTLLRSHITDHNVQGSWIQLAGRDPEIMGEVARMIENQGAKMIDLNFGCPAKKVTNGFAGSALMKDEKLAEEIIKKITSSVSIPVTLKMRMGWCENSLNAPNIAKIAEDAGVAMLTVHGRTRNQFYTGAANWKFVEQIKNTVKIPVIINGDIKNYESLTTALYDSKADGAMIGRATYGNPWLIEQLNYFLKTNKILPDPTLEEKFHTIKQHLYDTVNFYGEELGIKTIRKHIHWYISGLFNASKIKSEVNQSTTTTEVIDILDKFYDNLKIGTICG